MLFTIRETLRLIYAKFDTWLKAGGKFLLALLVFMAIRSSMGQFELLNGTILLLVLALLASFLPFNAIVLFGTFLIIGHLYAVSLPAMLIGTGVMVVILILYFGLAPGHALSLILMPLALALRIPLLLPLSFGLLSTPLSGVGMAAGTIGYYSVKYIVESESLAGVIETEAVSTAFLEKLLADVQQILNALLNNSEMVLTLIAVLAALIVVYAIRRTEMRFAWQIAIVLGTVIYLVIDLFGCMTLQNDFSILQIVISTAVSVVTAFLLQLCFFDLDYKKTEKHQFEDDDYYYYVTAVPKRKRKHERAVEEWTQ